METIRAIYLPLLGIMLMGVVVTIELVMLAALYIAKRAMQFTDWLRDVAERWMTL